jgi:hypothetical protein
LESLRISRRYVDVHENGLTKRLRTLERVMTSLPW